MVFKIGFLSLVSFLFFSSLSLSQITQTRTIVELGHSGRNAMINEKVNLHLDRNSYLAGEIIHFQVYCYDGTLNIPLNISKIAYIELYNQDNSPVAQVKISLDKGFGSGFIVIPKHLQSDYFYIRGYTNYMKNFGCDQFFMKRIIVINPFEEIDVKSRISSTINSNSTELQFFPESGRLIYGIESKVVFRFADKFGRGLNIEGEIVDQDGNSVLNFQTKESGFGWFKIKPEKGKKYKAMAMVNNRWFEKEIPLPYDKGITMDMENLDSDMIVVNLKPINYNGSPLELLVYGKRLKYSLRKNILAVQNKIVIDKKELPSGIFSLVLNDNSENVVSFRNLYIPETERLNIQIKANKTNYGTREKVVLDITTTNNQGNYVEAQLSLAANLFQNKTQVQDYKVSDFINKSGITNYINNIPIKFAEKLIVDENYMDMVLIACSHLTVMGEVYNPQKNIHLKYLPEINGDIISGKVKLAGTNNLISNTIVSQSFIDSISMLNLYTTDQQGRFYFQIENKGNQSDIIVRVKDTTNKYEVLFDKEFFPHYKPIFYEMFKIDTSKYDFIKDQMLNIQINDAYKEFLKKTDEKKIDLKRTKFYGREDSIYYLDNYIKLPTMEEFIFEIISGVSVIRKKGRIMVRLEFQGNEQFYSESPLFIVDGVPFFYAEEILHLDPEGLKYMRVINARYLYQDQIFDGIIDIVTKKGGFNEIELPINTKRFEFVSVQEPYEFSFPDYSGNQGNKPNVPDFRNLIYWNHSITTDKDGKAKISFYAPDNPGKCLINVNGVTIEGVTGKSEADIVVQDK